MRPHLLTLVTALLLAGCLEAGTPTPGSTTAEIRLIPTDPGDRSRDAGQYWMVWVHGNETPHGAPSVGCMRPPDHDLDTANRRLTYNPDEYALDPTRVRVIVAFDHYRPDGCVAAYRLVIDPLGPFTQDLGGHGGLTLEVRADGTLVADGQTIPLGQAAEFRYSRPDPADGIETTGAFRVENLGAWDQARLQAVT